MIVKPLNDRRRPRPVAIVAGAGWHTVVIHDDDGEHVARGPQRCADLLRRYAGYHVFGLTGARQLLNTTGARVWEGYRWKGALVRMTLDGGPTILSLRRVYPQSAANLPATIDGIRLALDWLAERGVQPGSLGSMAWRLWRSTLAVPVSLKGPRQRETLVGGRQEAPHVGTWSPARLWDISAAYPTAMSDPYPVRMIRVSPSTHMGDGQVGIARASVALPRLPWGPIPVRVGAGAVCYGWGEASGWWTWRELALAQDAGAVVDVEESWAGVGYLDLFGPWWQDASELRQLPGPAAKLGKALTSTLWGQFALSTSRGEWVRWEDDHGRREVVVPDQRTGELPHVDAVHVAAETTARVRERLYREALADGDGVLYVDTDGVITDTTAPAPGPAGMAPGEWRTKAIMDELEIRAPQVYRWTCPTCAADHARWHYCVAGVPAGSAERVFSSAARDRRALAGMAPGSDLTLPADDVGRLMAAS